jgi:hypothetical protein
MKSNCFKIGLALIAFAVLALAAGQVKAQTTTILSVDGTVYEADSVTRAPNGLLVEVSNLSKPNLGVLTDRTGETAGEGRYSITFLSFTEVVAPVGDVIEIAVTDAEGNITRDQFTLTAEEVIAVSVERDIILSDIMEFTLALSSGVNMISVPLDSGDKWQMSDLATLIGPNLTMIAHYGQVKSGKFDSYKPDLPKTSPANAMVKGDQGYIVVRGAGGLLQEGLSIFWADIKQHLVDLGVDSKLQPESWQAEYFQKIQFIYNKLFSPRELIGVKPRDDTRELYFRDGDNQEYWFDGLSSGEKQCLLFITQFARYRINRSIVLIDEVELHLHPTSQLELLKWLPQMGHDNQFIITTHSPYVAEFFPPDSVITLGELEEHHEAKIDAYEGANNEYSTTVRGELPNF